MDDSVEYSNKIYVPSKKFFLNIKKKYTYEDEESVREFKCKFENLNLEDIEEVYNERIEFKKKLRKKEINYYLFKKSLKNYYEKLNNDI